ncbi:MAG: hypothetical protein LDL41_18210 [Coleofasciculus sp. S288]|nr:hypothetical protein [Coleofasciculus sp. S288]
MVNLMAHATHLFARTRPYKDIFLFGNPQERSQIQRSISILVPNLDKTLERLWKEQETPSLGL